MNKTGKIIRIVGIILMRMTAAMNLLGGIGTTCAAFSNNIGYRMAFIELQDYRWLYQIFVVTTILIGLAGIWATVKLVKGGSNVYRDVMIVLIIGTVVGGIHYFSSMALRGEAAPANVKFYINVLTLIVFLIFRIPGIWKNVDFNSPGGKNETKSAVGLAAITTGIITLSIFSWAGPSHTFFQENWTYVLQVPLIIVGAGLALWGIVILGQSVVEIILHENPVVEYQPSQSKV